MKFKDVEEVGQVFEEFYSATYRERFSGLPIVNQALSVRVVGLRETDEVFTFCLVTPWMLNQVFIPKEDGASVPGDQGMRLDEVSGLGRFFVGNVESPMDRFLDMEMAIEVAEKCAEELFAKFTGETPDDLEDSSRREALLKIVPHPEH